MTVGQPELIAPILTTATEAWYERSSTWSTPGARCRAICGSSSAGSPGTTASSATASARPAFPPPCSGWVRGSSASTVFTVRTATTAHIGMLAAIEAEAASGSAFGPSRAGVRVELARRREAGCRQVLVLARHAGGGAVGYVAHQHPSMGWSPCMPSSCGRGANWLRRPPPCSLTSTIGSAPTPMVPGGGFASACRPVTPVCAVRRRSSDTNRPSYGPYVGSPTSSACSAPSLRCSNAPRLLPGHRLDR